MSIRVLIVEPEPGPHRFLAIKLARAGFAVSTALTAPEAREKAGRDKPDVIVLGTVVRDAGEGLDSADLMHLFDPHAPVIIRLSTDGSVEDIVAALQGGADDYLVAPVAPRVLVERIAVALVRAGRAADLPAGLHLDHLDRPPSRREVAR